MSLATLRVRVKANLFLIILKLNHNVRVQENLAVHTAAKMFIAILILQVRNIPIDQIQENSSDGSDSGSTNVSL